MAPAGVEMKQVRLWKNPRSSGGFGPELHPLVGGAGSETCTGGVSAAILPPHPLPPSLSPSLLCMPQAESMHSSNYLGRGCPPHDGEITAGNVGLYSRCCGPGAGGAGGSFPCSGSQLILSPGLAFSWRVASAKARVYLGQSVSQSWSA